MTNKPDDTCMIVVTADERRTILEQLFHRNRIRRETNLPVLDIRNLYHLKVQQLRYDKHHKNLEPSPHRTDANGGACMSIAGM